MSDFSDFINYMELVDLQLTGGKFTWKKWDRHVIDARLDRFLISEVWDEGFRNIRQFVVHKSNHSPLMLQCGNWDPVKFYFKFENWCYRHRSSMKELRTGRIPLFVVEDQTTF